MTSSHSPLKEVASSTGVAKIRNRTKGGCQRLFAFVNLVARAIRNAIRANRFVRIIRNRNPYFYSASGRFAQMTPISDSRESPDSRESCESIRANHATKFVNVCSRLFAFVSVFASAFACVCQAKTTQSNETNCINYVCSCPCNCPPAVL